MLESYLARWDLIADGTEIRTRSSVLLPVRHQDVPAMLKIAHEEEERWGGQLMAWWDGDGAARVLAQDENALLLERAMGKRSLKTIVANGGDDEATRILCAVAARLHAPRRAPPPDLVPLSRWFAALAPAARTHGGIFTVAAAAANDLLAEQRDVVVLHGDLHHDNVLDGGNRGWLAIDPKRLVGERAFEFVNLLRNPDAGTALAPGRFERQVEVVVEAATLDRKRFLRWIAAFACLSAAWRLADGEALDFDLQIARLAAAA